MKPTSFVRMHASVVAGYNQWAATYDTVVNKTRDAEALCLRQMWAHQTCDHIAEIGCGTGKNTAFLLERCKQLFALDASEEMLQQARQKITAPHVQFIQANLLEPWPLHTSAIDAVVFSLVLEHIEDLHFPFAESARVLRPGGLLYVGELHPQKQYAGSGARFESEAGMVHLPAYTHHVTDYLAAANHNGFILQQRLEPVAPDEFIPRILALLFTKC